METIDLKKALKPLYSAKAAPGFLDVPALSRISIEGEGAPDGEAFADAMQALYATAYGIKFSAKKTGKADWPVMPLEGLWWCDRMAEFSMENKGNWKWLVFIVQPDIVDGAMVEDARGKAGRKRESPAIGRLKFERFEEGRVAQYLHVGPYDAEGPGIAALHDFIRRNGCELIGLHHEIYLGDPRKAAPEKLKTIIRQPCRFSTREATAMGERRA
jgi:hypothetical protein